MAHAEAQTRPDAIWLNARLVTFAADRPGIGAIERGALAARDGRLVFVGEQADLPIDWRDGTRTIDCGGRWITPGFIDCHTHLVYAGDRAHEFELRLAGANYQTIAREGGGIAATVAATRAASEDELVRQSLPRLDALIAEGVTTVEIKSGYGLELAAERRILRAARRFAIERPIRVRTTFLGAHAIPPEFSIDRGAYLNDVVEKMLPALAADALIDAVDGFCETIAFSRDEIARVFTAARARGFRVKLHADQLSNGGGAAFAAAFGALSADHLEYLDEEGANAMARVGTVATLLPGAYYFVRETRLPPIETLRMRKIPIAIATDSNPGTSPLTSLLLTMNMAATLFRLTVEECLIGVTRNAARALGLADEVGTLEAGKRCDLAIWDIERPAQLVYRIGLNPLHARVWGGA